jgi:tetratricopeptide (TPR) repeat protein
MQYRLRVLMIALVAVLLLECHRPGAIVVSARAAETPTGQPVPANARITLEKLKPAVSKPTAAADNGVPRRAQKAVDKAKTLISDGKYAMAVPLLVERALGFAPNSAEVHSLLAQAYMQMPDAGKALTHMKKAVELDGDSVIAQVKLAQLLLAQKQNDKAIIALRTALVCSQSSPENPVTGEALLRLGKLLDQSGYWRASLDCFETLSDNIDKHARKYASRPVLRNMVLRPQRLLTRRGELLVKLKQHEKAAPLLKRAFARDRTNAVLAGLIVDSLSAAKKFKETEKFLVELTAQPSLQAKLPELAATTAMALGDKTAPMRIWKACGSSKWDCGKLAVSLAQAAKKLGAPEEGLAILQGALDIRPGDVAVTKFLVAMYSAQGKGEKVFESLVKLLIAEPARDDAVGGQLDALIKAGVAKDFAKKFAPKITSAPKKQQAALHYLTARLASVQGDKALALTQYAQAVKIDPAFLPTYAHLAEIYDKNKQKDKLIALMKNLDSLPGGQDSFALYYAKGKVQIAMGDAIGAQKTLQAARRIDPRNISAIEALGDALFLSGRSEATAAYRLVLKLAPERTGINKKLFDAYMARRSFSDAEKVARAMLAEAPKDRDTKIMLARVLVATGAHDEASKLLDELKARTSNDRVLMLLAIRVDLAGYKSVMFKKDFDKAVASLEKFTTANSSDREGLMLLARMFSANGQYQRATKQWDKLLKLRNDNIVGRLRIETLMSSGRYDQAAAAIQKMLVSLPGDSMMGDKLFTCLKMTDKNEDADKLLAKRLAQATDATKAFTLRLNRLNFLQEAKMYDQMQSFMDDWILVDSDRAVPLKNLKMEMFLLAEQYPKAVEYAKKVLARTPTNHEIKLGMVKAMTKAKSFDKAHKLLDKWIDDARKNPVQNNGAVFNPFDMVKSTEAKIDDYQGRKAAIYAAAGQLDQATAYVDGCLKKKPTGLMVRSGLIVALGEAKKHDLALSQLDKWIKALSATATTLPTGGAPSPNALALKWSKESSLRVMLMKKDYAAVVKRAGKYLAGDAKNIDLLLLRSSAYNELKQADKALIDIRAIYKLAPDKALYCNNLGYQLADMGIELPEAERLIRRAISDTDPSSVSYVAPLDSLGWVLYKQGKLHAAGRVFLSVIRRSREQKYLHPILYDHAADGFYRLGWTDKAIELWTKALKVAAEDKTEAREVASVKNKTPQKIKDAKAGKPVQVAPLGKGIKIQDK